jgi:signal transduction histidine kinase
MVSMFLVLIPLIGSINGINVYRTESNLNKIMNILTENQGQFPKLEKNMIPKTYKEFEPHMDEETPFRTRYFTVNTDQNGSILEIDTSHIIAVTSEDAADYANQVMNQGKESGYKGIYKYSVVEQEDGYLLVFMDCRTEIQNEVGLLLISCIVAFVTLLLMFILTSVLSKKAIKPIIENAEKQKQFITDAGHEIKTPLAIISANADVLELTGGENEWINSIRNQTARLDKLVRNLLTLAKTDEDNIKLVFAEFDYSETVQKMAAPFEAMAVAANKSFRMEIQPDIQLLGDKSSIEQLVSTLVDNAVKYSNEQGMIKITLSSGKKGTRLEVFNTAEGIDTKNLDRMFDRFYRADSSRSRDTGGYGIGLSIAKSIVEAHHGRISAKSEDGKSISFTVMI